MRISIYITVLLASQLLLSCAGDDDGDSGGGRPVEILPATTVLMEFETFAVYNGRQESFGNAIRAGGYISSWKKYINNDLALPLTAYLVSTQLNSQFTGGASIWNAEFKLNGKQYNSTLSAMEDETGVTWKMLISEPGAFEDFTGIEGHSASDRSSGSWSFFKYPVDSLPALTIAWNQNAEGVVDQMKYTANMEQSYLDYSLTGEANFDGSYELMNNGNAVSIGWNRDKKNGYIMEPAYYQDELEHCWNSSFEDDSCQ